MSQSDLEQTRQEAYRAFLKRDYRRAVELATDLTEANLASKQERLLIGICLQRLGNPEIVRSTFGAARDNLENNSYGPLELWLWKLLLGDASLSDVLAAASDDKQRCQAYYYEGARRLTSFETEEAREAFSKCLEMKVHCLEAQLASFEIRELSI